MRSLMFVAALLFTSPLAAAELVLARAARKGITYEPRRDEGTAAKYAQ